MSIELDKFDHHILQIIQKDCRLSARNIGDTVGLSASATQRRLTALRASGVIHKEVALVNPSIMGRELTLIIEVVLEDDDAQVVKQFCASVDNYSAVSHFYYVTGQSDYVIIFQAHNMEEFDAFSQAVFFKNTHVKTFNTKVVIKPIKSETALSF